MGPGIKVDPSKTKDLIEKLNRRLLPPRKRADSTFAFSRPPETPGDP